MPRYEVQVRFKQERTVPIKVWARDEQEAEEKACEVVERWENVVDVEADDVEEISE